MNHKNILHAVVNNFKWNRMTLSIAEEHLDMSGHVDNLKLQQIF